MSVTVCDAHGTCLSRLCVCHVCDPAIFHVSVTSVGGGGPGRGSKFLPLNFNTSFQFVFHKRSNYFYINTLKVVRLGFANLFSLEINLLFESTLIQLSQYIDMLSPNSTKLSIYPTTSVDYILFVLQQKQYFGR